MTFGLQPYHIEKIEAEFKRWNEPIVGVEASDPKFVRAVWDRLGKEVGWEPFTLCLYYFKHIENDTHKGA